MGSVAGSATLQLCGLGHITQPLRASVSSAALGTSLSPSELQFLQLKTYDACVYYHEQ